MKLKKIYVEKKFLFGLRAIFFMVAFYFLQDVYSALSSEAVVRRGKIITLASDATSFYVCIFKEFIFALVFLICAVFIVKSKPEKANE